MERVNLKSPGTETGAESGFPFCVVLGCRNSEAAVKTWKKSPCRVPSHARLARGKCGCDYPAPFFPFPKSEKLRKTWLRRIGRPDLEVNAQTQVCGVHFAEGKPTPKSFFPTLYLDGYADREEDMEFQEEVVEMNNNDGEPEAPEDEAFMPVIKNSYHVGDVASPSHLEGPQGANGKCTQGNNVVLMQQIKPIAKYDPKSEMLQIADPVKYIAECHNRIAQLMAENESLKRKYESEIDDLRTENKMLKDKLLAVSDGSNAIFPD